MSERASGSASSLSRKVVWPGHITHTAATCLSASPCRQNRRCAVPKDTLSNQLICPTVAQNFRNADAYRRYFLKGFCCRWLGWGGGQQVFGVKLLRKSSMIFLADDPANLKIAALGKVCLKGLLGQRAHCQERWCGQVTSRILRQPALAPALAVKIDAAPFQKWLSAGPCHQNRGCVVPKVRPNLSNQLICSTGRSKNDPSSP